MTFTADFAVAGMTCDHCVTAVSGAISALPGVVLVSVDLAPGDLSRVCVTSLHALPAPSVEAAVDEAGYEMVWPGGPGD